MVIARLGTLLFLVFCETPVFANDPHPPQLAVSFLAVPAPIVQYGSTRLVYEMLITNFFKSSYILDSIEAKAGDAQSKFDSATLAAMIVHLGVPTAPDSPNNRTIDGGRSVIVFFMLDLGNSKVPSEIAHLLHVVDDHNEGHDLSPTLLPILEESPIVVAPPLRGEWIAGDSVNNRPDAAHRRAVLIENGHAWLAQRFAIDWVQYQTIDGVRTTWVIDMADGLPENEPHSGKYAIAIGADNAAGNHVVVEIAPQRYVLYAHMRPAQYE